MAKKVVFLGTGGTIAGRSMDRSDNVGYQAAQVGVTDLLAGLPLLTFALQGITPESEQVAQADSKDMDWPLWQVLHARALHHLQRDDVGALVICDPRLLHKSYGTKLLSALPAMRRVPNAQGFQNELKLLTKLSTTDLCWT